MLHAVLIVLILFAAIVLLIQILGPGVFWRSLFSCTWFSQGFGNGYRMHQKGHNRENRRGPGNVYGAYLLSSFSRSRINKDGRSWCGVWIRGGCGAFSFLRSPPGDGGDLNRFGPGSHGLYVLFKTIGGALMIRYQTRCFVTTCCGTRMQVRYKFIQNCPGCGKKFPRLVSPARYRAEMKKRQNYWRRSRGF